MTRVINNVRIIGVFLLLGSFCLSMYGDEHKHIGESWQNTMKIIKLKTDEKKYDFILDNLLAPEYIKVLKKKYGNDWRESFKKEKLSSLSYYFGWLKNAQVSKIKNKVTLKGQHGCFAVFTKTGKRWLLNDFGQNLFSM